MFKYLNTEMNSSLLDEELVGGKLVLLSVWTSVQDDFL